MPSNLQPQNLRVFLEQPIIVLLVPPPGGSLVPRLRGPLNPKPIQDFFTTRICTIQYLWCMQSNLLYMSFQLVKERAWQPTQVMPQLPSVQPLGVSLLNKLA